ncbi:MAG: PQQ-binding-like beta-propeller repeat protein [Candidatus Bathyarchaeota archaeon]|nr:PQQ-binding-like beta-propeller repeat protein [Candidatus Bathyarchaeota archaeon]
MNLTTQNKKLAFTTTVLLLLSITISLFAAIPLSQAHNPSVTYPVWCYTAVSTTPIGVGQEELITFWCNQIPPTASADSRYGDRWIFYLDVTKPDNTTETLGPFESDSVGGAYTTYVPEQTGNYSVIARMPAYIITGLPTANNVPVNSVYVNDTYGPATSDPCYFTVQTDPIQPWSETPLPNEYWNRPINSANRLWYVLAGNYLSGAAHATATNTKTCYGYGPESSHIVWSRPYYAGGTMDERYGDIGYHTNHYGGITLGNMIILNGKVIVSDRNTAHGNNGWWTIDLYTGQTLALDNKTVMPQFASIYDYESPNQHGGMPYLWRTSGVTLPAGYTTGTGLSTWEMLDGYTYDTITIIANVSASGTAVYGKDGSILRYNIATSGGKQYLTCWNSSAIPTELLGTTGTNYWQWRPQNYAVHDGRNGFSMNVTLDGKDGRSNPVTGSIYWVREGKDVVGGKIGVTNSTTTIKGQIWALNLDPEAGVVGGLLWNKTYTQPLSLGDYAVGSRPGIMLETVNPDYGVFIFRQDLTRTYWGYSLATGEQIWETEPESQMQFYGLSTADCCCTYEGNFITYGYGGEVNAYNITTGEKAWTYVAENQNMESPYGNYPTGVAAACDGKLYLTTSEHSATQPLFRGADLRCINATDGTEIWKILDWGAGMAAGTGVYIADGYLINLNSYDQMLYCFGKGPSATTISAPQIVPALGSSILLTGTVTDQTQSGRLNTNYLLEFSLKDTPAVSDDSMQAWMEYKFMQQTKPTNTTGVPVSIDTIDPNGNYRHIADVTSDATGQYAYTFTPDVPGTYQILASFAGTKSYYASSGQTYLAVGEAPPTAAPYPETVLPPTETYFAISTAAIIVAIAIVGAIIVLVLKKRP